MINVKGTNSNAYDKKFVFKNNAPFISYISKSNKTQKHNAEDLDTVMPVYNLIEYSIIYSNAFFSLWNHCGNTTSGSQINYSLWNSKPVSFNTNITGKLDNFCTIRI